VQSADLNKSDAAKLALRDSALVLSYIYKNYEDIVELPDELDILLKEIILNGSLDSMIHIDASDFIKNNVVNQD
jgi:hypothetical protein